MAVLILACFGFLPPENFHWTKKEVNQSVAVNQSVTLSWKGKYTALESNQDRVVIFKRYPEHDSSAAVHIGSAGIINNQHAGRVSFSKSPFKPHIAVLQSASVTEPAIIIKDITKQDEGFYRIEVNVGAAVVANHAIFVTVYGK